MKFYLYQHTPSSPYNFCWKPKNEEVPLMFSVVSGTEGDIINLTYHWTYLRNHFYPFSFPLCLELRFRQKELEAPLIRQALEQLVNKE